MVEVTVYFDIIISEAKVVKVEELVDILVLAAGKLEDLGTDGLVVGGPEPPAVCILEVAHSDLEEGTHLETAQREHASIPITVFIILLLNIVVGAGPPALDVLVFIIYNDVRVKDFQSLFGVN